VTYLPWFGPPFLAPVAPDTMETPRDQRTTGDVAEFHKSRFRPSNTSRKKSKKLRWVTTCLIVEPSEDSARKYAE